jgi:hypothetical protein
MELFQSNESLPADCPRVGNPGLELANTFGVKSSSELFVQAVEVQIQCTVPAYFFSPASMRKGR